MPHIKSDKLDQKPEAGIFVAYNLVSKAYRIFHPQTRKITVSRDVYFMESKQWNREGKQQALFPHQIPKSQLDEEELVDQHM